MKPEIACSLIINVARGDTPILEYSLPHILDTHNIRFKDVLIVIDEKISEGRIRQTSSQYSKEELYSALEQVRNRGYEFRQVAVSYKREDVQRTYINWFGHSLNHYRCAGGTPIYAFLYGLELARYDYRLHLDSDMLIYDPSQNSWITKAIEILEKVPQILFVNQSWGPQTTESPAPPSVPSYDLGFDQRVSQVFSSRCFLYSMEKLKASFLPIEASKYPLIKQFVYSMQNRSPYRALEHMISIALSNKDMYRADLDMEWGYNLHAWDKSVFQRLNIDDVLRQIQRGDLPSTHIGRHDLDYDLFVNKRI